MARIVNKIKMVTKSVFNVINIIFAVIFIFLFSAAFAMADTADIFDLSSLQLNFPEDSNPATFNLNQYVKTPYNNGTLSFSVTLEDTSKVDCSLAGSVLSMALTANFNGQSQCRIYVSNGTDFEEEAFTITVAPVNDPPTLSGLADVAVEKGSDWTSFGSIASKAGDVDGNTLSYSILVEDTSQVDCDVAGDGSLLKVKPASGFDGVASCTIQVNDGSSGSAQDSTAQDSFIITVNEVNNAPVIQLLEPEDGDRVGINQKLTIKVTGEYTDLWLDNGEGDDVPFQSNEPFSPQFKKKGDHNVMVYAIDTDGNPVTKNFTFNYDTETPIVAYYGPNGSIYSAKGLINVTLWVSTADDSICRYSAEDDNYDSMDGEMEQSDDDRNHTALLTFGDNVSRTYYVRCVTVDLHNEMNESKIITFATFVNYIGMAAAWTNESVGVGGQQAGGEQISGDADAADIGDAANGESSGSKKDEGVADSITSLAVAENNAEGIQENASHGLKEQTEGFFLSKISGKTMILALIVCLIAFIILLTANIISLKGKGKGPEENKLKEELKKWEPVHKEDYYNDESEP